MDKIYYASSDGTIRSSDGELYHWGWKKKDAKYIKRERKNGKWVYTYAENSKGANSGSGGSSTKSTLYDIAKANQSNKSGKGDSTRYNTGVANQVAEAQKKQKKAERQAQIDKIKDAFGKYVDGVKDKWEDAKEERKKDWEESKERGTEKAKKEAAERGQTFQDTDSKLDRTTTMRVGGELVVNRYNRGEISRFVDTAKEYIKDRLGYDERDALDVADAKYKYAERAEKNYQDRVAVATFNMGKTDPYDGSITYTDKEKSRIDRMEKNKQTMRENTAKAGKEASEAADAYFDTPLGKLEKARKAGEEWLDKLFGKKR